jgi:putative FmdB family regulatory protein
MPLREYQCDACGHRFEVIQKMSDPPLEVCPKCGGVVHKLQAAPAFHLKGTGWYVTDYAKKDPSGEIKKDSEAKKDGEPTKGSESKQEGESKKGRDSRDSAAGSTDKGESKSGTGKSTASTDSASSGTSAPASTSNPGTTKNS